MSGRPIVTWKEPLLKVKLQLTSVPTFTLFIPMFTVGSQEHGEETEVEDDGIANIAALTLSLKIWPGVLPLIVGSVLETGAVQSLLNIVCAPDAERPTTNALFKSVTVGPLRALLI